MRLLGRYQGRNGAIEIVECSADGTRIYFEEGIMHYCVANMPGAYARTATQALTNVSYPYIEMLADYGLAEACKRQPTLVSGINVMNGKVTCQAVADAHGMPFLTPEFF